MLVKRTVLRLVFSAPLSFCRKEGLRTPETTLPFKALRYISGMDCKVVPPERLRTPDPLITNQMLYQLSYRGTRLKYRLPGRAQGLSPGWPRAMSADCNQAHRHHQKCGRGGLGQALEAGLLEDAGGQRVVVERAQQQRRGQFLDAIDKDHQQRGQRPSRASAAGRPPATRRLRCAPATVRPSAGDGDTRPKAASTAPCAMPKKRTE